MKNGPIFLLLLCVNASLQSMEEEIPLLNQSSLIKNSGLAEKTFSHIQEQLHSITSVEYIEHIEAEPSLIDQIILENNQTLCSPTFNDLCHPKKLAIKTVLTLCLAGLFDGGISGTSATIFACCGDPSADISAYVCSPLYQSILAPISCCMCWSRSCIAVALVLDHDNYDPNYRAYMRKQTFVI